RAECGHGLPDRRRLDDDRRAANDSAALELFDALRDRRTGKADALRDLGGGRTAVLRKELQDLDVEIVSHKPILPSISMVGSAFDLRFVVSRWPCGTHGHCGRDA